MKNGFIQSWPLIFLPVAVILFCFFWFQFSSFEKLYIRQTEMELLGRARLLALAARPLLEAGRIDEVQKLCREEGGVVRSRVTVIDARGRVLADSEEEPARMDNHAMRPEILGALEAFRNGGESSPIVRFSSTQGQRLIYCAYPMRIGESLYIFRSAFSIHQADRVLGQVRLDIIVSVLLTALVAGGLSYIIFRTVSRPVLALCRASTKIAAGELDTRLPIPERGAIRELAESVSRMAEELKNRINDISREKSERDAIFSALAEGVIVLDLEENIIDINAAARQMFHLRENPLGAPMAGVVRNLEISDFLHRLREEKKPAEAEFTLALPDGTLQLRLRGTLVNWAGGQSGILLVIYDMTQLRRLENFRRDFVANVSHEIKTPLTVIRGAVETLRDGAIDEPESAARFMQIIELHSERLTSLVEDILSLSRLECHAVGDGSHFTTVGAALPVSTAMELAQARADSAGIKLVCTVESDPKIKADVQLLEQAVLNLIDNAIKHSGESREIRIRVGEEEGEAFIEVSDHGCGIPAEHLPRLFERFYRVDKARSRKAGGTGLGLAIVKHIMQLHRGRAEVKSRVGEGSTFTLRLPVAHS